MACVVLCFNVTATTWIKQAVISTTPPLAVHLQTGKQQQPNSLCPTSTFVYRPHLFFFPPNFEILLGAVCFRKDSLIRSAAWRKKKGAPAVKRLSWWRVSAGTKCLSSRARTWNWVCSRYTNVHNRNTNHKHPDHHHQFLPRPLSHYTSWRAPDEKAVRKPESFLSFFARSETRHIFPRAVVNFSPPLLSLPTTRFNLASRLTDL